MRCAFSAHAPTSNFITPIDDEQSKAGARAVKGEDGNACVRYIIFSIPYEHNAWSVPAGASAEVKSMDGL